MMIDNTAFSSRGTSTLPAGVNQPVECISIANPQTARSMELRAAVLLHSQPHLQRYSSGVQCCFRDRCLYLMGHMPSFYLKQLAQESLRSLDGIDRIENRIVVMPATFNSDEPQFEQSFRPHLRLKVSPLRPR